MTSSSWLGAAFHHGGQLCTRLSRTFLPSTKGITERSTALNDSPVHHGRCSHRAGDWRPFPDVRSPLASTLLRNASIRLITLAGSCRRSLDRLALLLLLRRYL